MNGEQYRKLSGEVADIKSQLAVVVSRQDGILSLLPTVSSLDRNVAVLLVRTEKLEFITGKLEAAIDRNSKSIVDILIRLAEVGAILAVLGKLTGLF